MSHKMSCFICEIAEERLFNVKSSLTTVSNSTYYDLIRTFVWKTYQFEIFDEDAVCQTCCVLLEELESFYSKSSEIESVLMAQICRKYQVDMNETPVYEINNQHLQLFNLVPFTKRDIYSCHKCSFFTIHEDCLVPHYKLHEVADSVVKEEPIEEHLFQCTICETLLANMDLLQFHIQLFHNDIAENLKETIAETMDEKYNMTIISGIVEDEEEIMHGEEHFSKHTEPQSDAANEVYPEIKIEEIVHSRCPLCEFCCVQPEIMDKHVRSVHGRRSFRLQRVKCQHCVAMFDNLNSLIKHASVHQEKSYKCCSCEMTSEVADEIFTHSKEVHMFENSVALCEDMDEQMQAETEPAFLRCNQCGKDLDGKDKCTHFGAKADDTHNCSECDGAFITNEELVTHMHSSHFRCDKCPAKCNSLASLQAHIRRRHTKHPCPHCDKLLGSSSSLQAHLTIHGLNAAYKCEVCDKGFKAKSLYETHMAIHTREYNYTCHICGQKFIHQRSHRIHVEWHANPRPHKCPLCEKTYKHRSHLAVHRRTHFGERPNACSHCERRFTSSSKLKVHMVVHTGIFSHPCQVCGKGFMKRYKLAEHMAKVHGDNAMLLNKPKCEYRLAVRPDPPPSDT